MHIVCLDMEGVLTPEIWVAFANATGIEELKRTTRDEPDYNKLMRFRLDTINAHGYKLKDVQDVIATLEPFDGAKEMIDKLKDLCQVIILSDTFAQFAKPFMSKLGYPTLFCNELVIAEDGTVMDFKMRCEQSKLTTVKGLQSIGFETIAAGDSFNDVGMILNSKAGFFFHGIDSLKETYPDVQNFEEYDDLYEAIRAVVEG